jgi:DNA-directed RNA polymerase subunit N (RpoN/RPB10)
MIIPIKCFTCGKVLADKYRFYQSESRKGKTIFEETVYLTPGRTEKTIEGKVLDQLEITKYCCRTHMLTHVDIE